MGMRPHQFDVDPDLDIGRNGDKNNIGGMRHAEFYAEAVAGIVRHKRAAIPVLNEDKFFRIHMSKFRENCANEGTVLEVAASMHLASKACRHTDIRFRDALSEAAEMAKLVAGAENVNDRTFIAHIRDCAVHCGRSQYNDEQCRRPSIDR